MSEKCFVFDCRSTGMGAFTSVKSPRDAEEFDHSRTGNHWSERVWTCEGDIIELIDISNSRKHRCKKYRVENGELKDITPQPSCGICPICEE